MAFRIKPLLLKFDFIGFIPQFRILEETRYKSLFSSFLSIAIIFFSIAFVFYSLADFLNQNPQVQYYKNNDYSTNKTYTISNSFLMFKNDFYCFSNDSHITNLTITIYDIKELLYEEIDYEPCVLGKNLDIKYKNIVETFVKVEETKINEYSCLNFHNEEFTLINNPLISDEFGNHMEFSIKSTCKDYLLLFNLITQNDFLEHNNKDNPIVPYYQKHRIRTSNRPTNLIFYYNYIKYDSDDGFIFSNKKQINGIGISNSNIYNKKEFRDNFNVLSIEFRLNGASYDYYQRSFIKFQAFLADVMSPINLIITICKVISEFFLYKKMNKDIVRNILS